MTTFSSYVVYLLPYWLKSGTVLFLAAILDLVLVLVFWTKMLFISICDSFSPVLVDENSRF